MSKVNDSVSLQTQDGLHRKGERALHGSVASGLSSVLVAEGSAIGHVVVLCAEPGMGKTTVLSQVIARIKGRSGKGRLVSLSGLSGSGAVSRVISLCRQFTHYADGSRIVALGLDDVPAMDESDSKRMSRAIGKFCSAGGNVVLAIEPEVEPLIDDLHDAQVYYSPDLRLTGRRIASQCGISTDSLERISCGIPRLVRAVMVMPGLKCDEIMRDPRYLSALGDVVEQSLRPSLIWEERWLRLAMIELGRGTLDDLRCVLGSIDESLVEAIERDAPFFGIDSVSETFSCVGVTDCETLRSMLPRLRPVMGRSLSTSDRVAELLMRRGDYRRASVVVLASEPRERTLMVLQHAVEFVDVGAHDTVEDAVSCAARMGLTDHVPEARLALASLLGSSREYDSLRASLGTVALGSTARLLVRFRDCLSSAKDDRAAKDVVGQGSGVTGGPADMRHALTEAVAALSLMRELQFEDAYEYLMGAPERASEPTVSSCVLWVEYMLSMGLSGNAPTEQDLSGFEAAIGFLAEAGIPFLHQIALAVGPLVGNIAACEDNASAAEACAQKAALAGMPLVEELCLVAAGVADLRADSCARAFVRIQRALELAKASDDTYIQGACHILACAAKRMLGESVTADEVLSRRMPPRLSCVGRALAAVIEGSDAVRLEVMGRTKANACPRGTAWLVQVLATCCGKLSQRFKMVAPRPWLNEARMAAIVAGEFAGERHCDEGAHRDPKPSDEAYRVDISVLGGFHIKVNGSAVSETHMERRRAKCLLALLAVLPEHTASRHEVMESIWPDLDFHDARQRVYEATSVLRRELTSRLGVKGEPLVSSRGAGTLGLDPSCVHCDVDDFERLAQSLVSNPRLRPTDVVNGCARLERLYRGDAFVPLVDGAGLAAKRRDELKALYADVMVYASQQAFALNRAETAIHFAQNACRAEPLREDAELCLIRALGAAGRRLDAESSYRAFVERMTREANRPVSQTLRDTYHELVGGGEELVLHMGGEDGEQAASA